ncbi:hypothetical protein LXA43DRAFT_1060973 [Ganoderma leucocontextum]|nr:hypothetical protein LXA43DRAFT_1060973 [Ganoderma leucocontextum]
MSLQSRAQWTIPRKNRSIQLDPHSIRGLEKISANEPAGGRMRPRSYLSPSDGVGWSFQKLFDPYKTWAALKAEMPYTLDFGLQSLPGKTIKFKIFWPGYDLKGITFPIKLWHRDGSEDGVRDYADLVLEIARCYDAFFQGCRSPKLVYKESPSLPEWNIETNLHYMVENLGLVEIRHVGGDVFYADVEYQDNVLVPVVAAPIPDGSYPRSTPESVQNEAVFGSPSKVSPQVAELLKPYLERFPYPSYEQCTRLATMLGQDGTLVRIWFENRQKKMKIKATVSPRMRLKAALASSS